MTICCCSPFHFTNPAVKDPAGIGEEGGADQRDRGRDQQGSSSGGGGGAAEGGGQAAAGAAAEGAHGAAGEARAEEEEALQVRNPFFVNHPVSLDCIVKLNCTL